MTPSQTSSSTVRHDEARVDAAEQVVEQIRRRLANPRRTRR